MSIDIPTSRVEEILKSKIDGTSYDKQPLSRVEELLIELNTGGGGGGTTNYNELENKPSINGHTITGDKSSEDYDIYSGTDDYNQLLNKPMINGYPLIGDQSADDLDIGGYNDVHYDSNNENLILDN